MAASFKARMEARGRGLVRSAEKIIRKAALKADQEVVQRTPVDTGRARSNWLPSLRVPVEVCSLEIAKDGNPALVKAARVIGKFKIDARSIYLTNNVVYIGRLENGYSQQAPNGMVKQSVLAAQLLVRGERVSIEP